MKAKTADIISAILFIIWAIWMIASIMEISNNHMTIGYQYHPLNFINLLFKV